MTTVGNTFWVDTETTTLREADHLLQTLAAELALSEDMFGCTHLVRGERPRIVLSFTAAASESETVTVAEAARHLTAKGYEVTPGAPDEAGRAVLYPGVSRLTGTLTIAELLSNSAVDHVTVLGSTGEPPPDQRVLTRDHVRPLWRDGALVLTAMPAAGGVLVPFEVPDPTPCCADH
ncbi:hypothetical protein [Streptomyces sporangiiformans]|uniref:Uncharacterized protein n=1 Tax=Streptomyces sporangiiformans TaxID=2315329 RepID=A0A505DRN1_9ACTN|nr:hypothetical protein [Streptomyces sporangiiformans]TPQ23835.1 hypothetical protein FGD71_001765 [Streptomyces sporangiiformans]